MRRGPRPDERALFILRWVTRKETGLHSRARRVRLHGGLDNNERTLTWKTCMGRDKARVINEGCTGTTMIL
jgi:hypothetical protein